MIDQQRHRISIPDRLRIQLARFRRALMINALRDALMYVLVVTLAVFWIILIADRFVQTPSVIRAGLIVLIAVAVAYRVWRVCKVGWDCRSALRVANVIARRDKNFGDHLIGALELAESESEQARSTSLCVGALEQVADEAGARDLHVALPPSQWRAGAWMLLVMTIALFVALVVSPQLVRNVAVRLTAPFGTTPRFTFVDLPELPAQLVVPHDEAVAWSVRLRPESEWVPDQASLTIDGQRNRATVDGEGLYRFEIPARIAISDATLKVGDAFADFQIHPKLRPKLSRIRAVVRLPDYLHQVHTDLDASSDVVGGIVELVEGATATLLLESSSALSRASVDGESVQVDGNRFSASVGSEYDQVVLDWTDVDGLQVADPVTIKVRRVVDARPTLLVRAAEIPVRVLNSQSLNFQLEAQDDFAVRRVGMRWESQQDSGEKILGPRADEAVLSANFQATALDVAAGEVQLRFWVEDDFPGRERVYSDPIPFDVLSPSEHAVWIAGQFAKWRQSAMDVRDRELNLFSRNKELATTDQDGRDQSWRDAVAMQARAEEVNGRQLQSLAKQGEELLREAARNQEVAVEYVEKLAQAIESLEQMADDRMPRVAALLEQAAKDQDQESKFAEMIDQETSQGTMPDSELPDSNLNAQSDQDQPDGAEESGERIGLAGTTIVDTSNRKPKPDLEEEQDALSLAVEDQTDLVAEFDAVAEELKTLLANMEGSTLVKRLKSVSRLQDRVAMTLGQGIEQTFGQPTSQNESLVQSVAADVEESASRVRTVLDDLEAFCERREIEHFIAVLNEMKSAQVLARLNELKSSVAPRPGVAMAGAEFWADNLDRWADDLVDPGSGKSEKGTQSNQSLSPDIILDVLRILESEVNLREQTRVTQQGREAMLRDEYMGEAIRLSETQDLLRDRLDVLVDTIGDLPNATLNFSGEMEVLGAASSAMVDASKTLVSPETGPVAIAAQTEAIELLLRSSKSSPESGSGEGGSSVGSNGGETDQAAIALLGRGMDQLAKIRDAEVEMAVSQQTGEIPERWRAGLQDYFNELESRRSETSGSGLE